MNTTPTRMAYDRIARQQRLSIAIAHTKEDVAVERRIAGNEPAPPIRIPIIRLFKVLMQCVVALITRNAVRRDGVYYLLRKGERTTPLTWSWVIPLAELCTGLCVFGACDLASILHW